MSFDSAGLYIDRGSYNNATSSSTLATHRYKNTDDALSAIATVGYFPAGLGDDAVVVNDLFTVMGSDGVDTYKITVLAPLTIEPLAEATGNVTGPGSATADAVAAWTDTSGALLKNTGVTIDLDDNLTAAGLFATGQSSKVGNSIASSDTIFHTQSLLNASVWVEGDTGNNASEAYHSAVTLSQDLNNTMVRIGYSTDNQVRIDMGAGTASPTNDFVISSGGTVVGGGTVGTMPTITPGTDKLTIPAHALSNLVANPGISLNNVTFTPVAANPGGAETLWFSSVNNHLYIGAVDLQA